MYTSKNIGNDFSFQPDFLDISNLKKLVFEMQKSLLKDSNIDYNPINQFSWSNTINYSPFGPNLLIEPKVNQKRVFYKVNRLRHKLLRIFEQLEFVKINRKRYKTLTQREREIIELLADGNNNPEIAEQLFISRSTVEQHRKNINRKLELKSFSHLMTYAYAFDLI